MKVTGPHGDVALKAMPAKPGSLRELLKILASKDLKRDTDDTAHFSAGLCRDDDQGDQDPGVIHQI